MEAQGILVNITYLILFDQVTPREHVFPLSVLLALRTQYEDEIAFCMAPRYRDLSILLHI